MLFWSALKEACIKFFLIKKSLSVPTTLTNSITSNIDNIYEGICSYRRNMTTPKQDAFRKIFQKAPCFGVPLCLIIKLSFPGYLSFQEISYLLWPVNIFQKHHRYFALLQILPFQPHIEKALRHESEKPCFVSIISCHIRPLLQFKQDIKKPGTVLIEQ